MKVIYTDQSIDSLEESLRFSMEELGLSTEKAASIKNQLLDRAGSLTQNPYKGQREEYLQHFKEDHRRVSLLSMLLGSLESQPNVSS